MARKTRVEIEASLREAADKMRLISAAAKDQRAKAGDEPTETARVDLGAPVAPPSPTAKAQG